MASAKNTIVLGCFILASAMAHAFLSGRYEGHITDSDFGRHRFDTWTGQFQKWGDAGGKLSRALKPGRDAALYKWHQITED